ncbi:polyketide synthase [Fusarium flagelliforme]|uniref:Polyketide synthase n=1 Tax=Fusarium flagelliforme TaxID=2675880 RepID=A0A395M524_9HYPO|nr:polyketide synthase [Fusarium flagelliforme]
MENLNLSWLESSFDNDNYADLNLICRDKSYTAHRVIVCPQSPVIARKLQSQFQSIKQGPSCDSCGGTSAYHYDLSQDDPQAADCLIQYFYHQDYQKPPRRLTKEDTEPEGEGKGTLTQSTIDDSYPILHVKVYALAEFYDIPALKTLALEKFNNVIKHNSQPDRFFDSVEEAYASMMLEDRELRHAIVNFFYKNPDLVKYERVQGMLKETNSLTYDLFMHWHGKQGTGTGTGTGTGRKAKPFF